MDTSFLPDREREEADLKLREELRLEWVMTQASLKDEPITVTFSYWDGSGHRRNVTLKKGNRHKNEFNKIGFINRITVKLITSLLLFRVTMVARTKLTSGAT